LLTIPLTKPPQRLSAAAKRKHPSFRQFRGEKLVLAAGLIPPFQLVGQLHAACPQHCWRNPGGSVRVSGRRGSLLFTAAAEQGTLMQMEVKQCRSLRARETGRNDHACLD